jgi:hypothetical protein
MRKSFQAAATVSEDPANGDEVRLAKVAWRSPGAGQRDHKGGTDDDRRALQRH